MDSKIEKLVLQLFDVEVLKFGNFKLKSGINSPIYIDLRIITSFPKLMDSLAEILAHKVQNCKIEKIDHICGVPYTALPMATLVSAKTQISMLIRRKEAKSHGTKKIIEGKFKQGDECIIIEDIISSGSSILETVEDLKKENLKVSCAIVVVDREQGGRKNLEDKDIKVDVITSITEILEILLKNNKISEQTVNDVKEYISNNKISIVDGVIKTTNGITKNRLTMPFFERAKHTQNEMTAKLFTVMEEKKSLLCVAADVTKTSELLKLAVQVGPHICILKTHFDAIEDFSKETWTELMKIAKSSNFIVMEDRKFSDIGNTIRLQYNQIKPWADLVTTHSIAGEGVLKALKSSAEGVKEKGCFLVAELSCDGSLISKEYSTKTVKMAESHQDFVVGLVCQSASLIQVPNLIQLTPGVKMEQGSDNLGQKYDDPEYVVLEKGADIAVVGRGIIMSSDPENTAFLYKEKLWNAYLKRTSAKSTQK